MHPFKALSGMALSMALGVALAACAATPVFAMARSVAIVQAGPKLYSCTGPFSPRQVGSVGPDLRAGDHAGAYRAVAGTGTQTGFTLSLGVGDGVYHVPMPGAGPAPYATRDARATTPALRALDDQRIALQAARNRMAYDLAHERWKPICSAAEWAAMLAADDEQRKAIKALNARFDLLLNAGATGATGG